MVNEELGVTRHIFELYKSVHNSSYKADRQILAHISACSRQRGEFTRPSDAGLRTCIMAELSCWQKLQEYRRIREACDLAERAMKCASARWAIMICSACRSVSSNGRNSASSSRL